MKTQNIIKTDQTSQEVKNISPNSELLNLFQVEELEQRYEMGWIKGEIEVEVKCEYPPLECGIETTIPIG